MADLMILYKHSGLCRANLNWQLCLDPNNKLPNTRDIEKSVKNIQREISRMTCSLQAILDDEEITLLIKECESLRNEYQESMEVAIERAHRPTEVFFNKKALFILTETDIPEDIQIGLSFGWKFLFPFACTDKNLCEILAQLDLTIEQAVEELKRLGATQEISQILRKQSRTRHDTNMIWLSFAHLRTKNFFLRNKHLFATRSDKGGHTVVLDIDQYDQKLRIMLSDSSYKQSDSDPLTGLVKQEDVFINKFRKDEGIAKLMKGMPPYEPNTLLLSKFYGLIKIHKKDFPLRPITAMIGCVGYLLGKIFNEMLKEVFPVTNHHIKDSYGFVEFINKVNIKNGDRLVSFDVVSMFTSIPTDLVEEIILSRSNIFFDKYSLNRADLIAVVRFLLVECTFFTARNETYKQIKGLPMGSCISPTLARIVMDRVVDFLLGRVSGISFIKVFVDDTIAAMSENKIDEALEALNDFMPGHIRFTKENENNQGSINFLNLNLKRGAHDDIEHGIVTNWYKKSFASGRLVNYYSSHKHSTIIATAVHFIKTVLVLSSPMFFSENKETVEQTLRENSFPESLIITLMQTHYTYMKPLTNAGAPFSFYDLTTVNGVDKQKTEEETPNTGNKTESKYIIFPYSIIGSKSIKRVLHRYKRPYTTLADSVKNTKLNHVKAIKTRTPLIARKNVIVTSECFCKSRIRICMTNFNETGLHTAKNVITKKKKCDEFSHAYNRVKVKRGLFYSNQTKSMVKYLQWKFRDKLDKTYKYEFPTSKLMKLIK